MLGLNGLDSVINSTRNVKPLGVVTAYDFQLTGTFSEHYIFWTLLMTLYVIIH